MQYNTFGIFFLDSLVCSNKPQTLNALKSNIIRVIDENSASLCETVTESQYSGI